MRIMAVFLLFSALPSLALAGGMDRHKLMAGSGVAHPTLNHATGTNPAGLMGVDRFKLAVGLGSGGGDLDGTVGLLFGQDTARWAGTIGAGSGGGGNSLFVGAATHLRSLKTAVGVGYGRSGDALGQGAGNLNVGVIVNPATVNTVGDSAFRVAGVVYGALETPVLGAGFEWDTGRTFSLVTDVVFPTDLSVVRAHPALLVGSGDASFTLGYSFEATSGSGGELTLGVGMELGSNVDWQFYYNQFDRLFLALAVRL